MRNYLPDREVIVATHMPLNDWSHDVEYHGGYVYLSGHTHRNEFYDDGIKRLRKHISFISRDRGKSQWTLRDYSSQKKHSR